MNKEYISYLKSVKKKKKITNEKLAYLSNTPLGTINKLFSGDTQNPKMSTVSAICRALDVSMDNLDENIINDEVSVRMTLKRDEADLVKNWQKLDFHGKKLISDVISHEISRIAASRPRPANILAPKSKTAEPKSRGNTMSVFLYELPVSAGLGMFLEDTSGHEIDVPADISYEKPDFALKIRGDSMEPEYNDGDIILVKNASSVEKGELGIFNVDGEAFFKIFGGNRLISLNKKYKDIRLPDELYSACIGKVVAKL